MEFTFTVIIMKTTLPSGKSPIRDPITNLISDPTRDPTAKKEVAYAFGFDFIQII